MTGVIQDGSAAEYKIGLYECTNILTKINIKSRALVIRLIM